MRFEILCDRCRKPVDRVDLADWFRDAETAAYCHGERETFRLSPYDLESAHRGFVVGAMVFRVSPAAAAPEGFAIVPGGRGASLLIDIRDPEAPPQNVTAHDRDGSTTSHVARSTENGTV